MGYACPVCDHPQSDARHLANHLAFTALARGGDHEAWLADHVPDWESLDETALGDRVTEYADETEFPQVFEDTTPTASHNDDHASHGSGHDHDHDDRAGHDHADRGRGHGHPGRGREGGDDSLLEDARSRAAGGAFSDDAEDVLAEARELTRKRRENATADASGDADEASPASESDGASSTGETGDADESETE